MRIKGFIHSFVPRIYVLRDVVMVRWRSWEWLIKRGKWL